MIERSSVVLLCSVQPQMDSIIERETHMKILKALLFALALTFGAATSAVPVSAGEADPLLIKVVNDDAHRIHGALMFAETMAKDGHPVTVWITDRAVRIGSKERAGNLGDLQHTLNDLLKAKARIVLCPMCMAEYGVKESDLIPGMTIGDPALISQIIFKDNAKVITW